MRIFLHLKPGQKGTRQLFSQYGDRLVCVRYRYDAQQKKRFKTVEIIVAECPWEPPEPCIPADTLVDLRIGFAEVDIRERVKQAGGKWNPHRKVWELRYAQVVALKLETRLVAHEASTYRCLGNIYMQMPVSTYRCKHLHIDAAVCSRLSVRLPDFGAIS